MEQEFYRTDPEKLGYIEENVSSPFSKKAMFVLVQPEANTSTEFPSKQIKTYLETAVSRFSGEPVRHIRASKLPLDIILDMIASKVTSDTWFIYVDPRIDDSYDDCPELLVFDKSPED